MSYEGISPSAVCATPVVVSKPVPSDSTGYESPMKRDPSTPYAHAGRRRRRITEELIRCPTIEIVHGQQLPCNALVWDKPEKLREHLKEHRPDSVVRRLTDQEVREWYVEAKTIHQEGIQDHDGEEGEIN